MRRLLITAAAVAALGAGVATAEAAISKGKFEGLVGAKANGDAFGFKVDKSGRVYSVHFSGVRLSCTDGDTFDSPSKEKPDGEGATEIRTSKNTRFTVDTQRRWGFTAANKDAGNGYDVAGTFKSTGNSSKGTLQIKASFDEQNQPDPNGRVKCDSGPLKWSAKRQK